VIADPAGAVVARAETAVAVAANTTATMHQRLRVADARLWFVETPDRYTLSSELLLDGAAGAIRLQASAEGLAPGEVQLAAQALSERV
jgi:hypothetical protein